MKHILIVDDEPSILMLLAFNLEKEGYRVEQATDGVEAYRKAMTTEFDFIVMDLMLSGMSGIEVCKELRAQKNETPLLILTAKDDEYDRIIGLELGADDYMTKPFSPRELIARIKAILRRSERTNLVVEESTPPQDQLIAGEILVQLDAHEVMVRGERIELTPKQYELLIYMMQHTGKTLSREVLLNAVWDYEYVAETRIVDVHIGNLREKIEKDSKNPSYFKTVRGFGYKFEVPSL